MKASGAASDGDSFADRLQACISLHVLYHEEFRRMRDSIFQAGGASRNSRSGSSASLPASGSTSRREYSFLYFLRNWIMTQKVNLHSENRIKASLELWPPHSYLEYTFS